MKCDGCGEEFSVLIEGEVTSRFSADAPVEKVKFCRVCWEIVDHCDPVTGAYGAGCCEVKRASSDIMVVNEITYTEAQLRAMLDA